MEYTDISDKLKHIGHVKDKYIILPNVSGKGSYHILKERWHIKFKKMPYVGGYLDQDLNINNLNDSAKSKLEGKTPEWGNRFIYPLQRLIHEVLILSILEKIILGLS